MTESWGSRRGSDASGPKVPAGAAGTRAVAARGGMAPGDGLWIRVLTPPGGSRDRLLTVAPSLLRAACDFGEAVTPRSRSPAATPRLSTENGSGRRPLPRRYSSVGTTMRFTAERYTPEAAGSLGQQIVGLYHQFAYTTAAESLSAGRRALDIGFGDGYGPEISRRSGADYVGLEVEVGAVSHARDRYAGEFRLYDGVNLPSEPFDLAICFQVLEHLDDPDPLLSQISSRGCPALFTAPNRELRLNVGERPWNVTALRRCRSEVRPRPYGPRSNGARPHPARTQAGEARRLQPPIQAARGIRYASSCSTTAAISTNVTPLQSKASYSRNSRDWISSRALFLPVHRRDGRVGRRTRLASGLKRPC